MNERIFTGDRVSNAWLVRHLKSQYLDMELEIGSDHMRVINSILDEASVNYRVELEGPLWIHFDKKVQRDVSTYWQNLTAWEFLNELLKERYDEDILKFAETVIVTDRADLGNDDISERSTYLFNLKRCIWAVTRKLVELNL